MGREGDMFNLQVDKVWAQQMLNDWVRDGRIIKPKRCYECGEIKELEAHHDDYKHPLRVYWFCTKCHGIAGRKHEETIG